MSVEEVLARSRGCRSAYSGSARSPIGPKSSPDEDVGEADDRVERRPELVAHIGEELRLGAARGLGARGIRHQVEIAAMLLLDHALGAPHHADQQQEHHQERAADDPGMEETDLS